jgi:hypothetical protein
VVTVGATKEHIRVTKRHENAWKLHTIIALTGRTIEFGVSFTP